MLPTRIVANPHRVLPEQCPVRLSVVAERQKRKMAGGRIKLLAQTADHWPLASDYYRLIRNTLTPISPIRPCEATFFASRANDEPAYTKVNLIESETFAGPIIRVVLTSG